MDRGVWWATVYGVAKSLTSLSMDATPMWYHSSRTDIEAESPALEGEILTTGLLVKYHSQL